MDYQWIGKNPIVFKSEVTPGGWIGTPVKSNEVKAVGWIGKVVPKKIPLDPKISKDLKIPDSK